MTEHKQGMPVLPSSAAPSWVAGRWHANGARLAIVATAATDGEWSALLSRYGMPESVWSLRPSLWDGAWSETFADRPTTARPDGMTAHGDYALPFAWSAYPTARTTARPNLGTDGVAVISESVRLVALVEATRDDVVTVTATVRLLTGSAEYVAPNGIGHDGTASGDVTDYRHVVRAAIRNAETAARAYRSARRADMRTIGADDMRADMVTRADYDALQRLVMRRAYGNARTVSGDANRSARPHVRAGVRAAGMPLQDDVIADATQNAALVLWRRRSNGTASGDVALDRATAARDGLRLVTQQRTATADARRRAEWQRARMTSHATDGTANDTRRTVAARTDAAHYVGAGSAGSDVVDSILSDPIRYRTLAALLLGDGTVADAARILFDSDSGPRRTQVKRDARAEWSDMVTRADERSASDALLSLLSGDVGAVIR